MNTNELSPEARRRLWQCYLLLLELADQAEEEAGLDPELDENQDLETISQTDELSQQSNKPSDVAPDQVEISPNERE